MLSPSFSEQAVAWLLTYLLHGTLLLGLAWLVSKPLSRWSPAAEETVWKLALVGALLTASLQVAAGWEPAGGRWGLADLAAPAAVEAVEVAPRRVPVRAERSTLPAPGPSAPVTARAAAAPLPAPKPSVSTVALGLWGLGATLLLALYLRSFARLGRLLDLRPRVVGGTLHSQLRKLSGEAGFGGDVRLTCSSRIPVPLAFGLGRPEICLPPKALAGLTDEQQEGMLAHELAHLVRRDPFWLVVSQVVACVFFFQPLNWVARRRLRELSELLSDEWAVGRTGRPLSLAGCLAEVAGWATARRALPVPGMADRPSHLALRIRRLLDRHDPESPARRLWLGAAMVALLIAVAAAAPAVSVAGEPAASPEKSEPKSLAGKPVAAEPALGEPTVATGEEHPPAAGEAASEVDVDVDVDVDLPDLDGLSDLPPLDVDVSAVMNGALASLGSLDGTLAGLSEDHALSDEERKELQAEMERASEHLRETLKVRMDKLSRELSGKLQGDMPAEMRKLEEEMRKLGEQMRPTEAEISRLRAQVDEEVRKSLAEGKLSSEERQRIAREAREEALKARPTAEQRKEMEDLRRQLQEIAREYRTEHNRAMQEATREMREEIRREMQATRDEMRRSMEQRRLLDKEQRKERREDQNREPEKNRKMVLKMDLTGKLELVPDEPGC